MEDMSRAHEFLRQVAEGRLEEVRAALAREPELVNAPAPHPYHAGLPQPLHIAVEAGSVAMVELLLDAGADPDGNNREYAGWSPLMLAIQRQRDALVRLLRERGARVGFVEALMLGDDGQLAGLEPPAEVPGGGSLLAFARTPGAIDRLLRLGAPAGLPDQWGVTPVEAISRLEAAVALPLVRHLAARGVSVPEACSARLGQDTGSLDPAVLLAAVESGQRAVVERMLDRGVPVNARKEGQSRQTALHVAAWNGDRAMVELLLSRGADREALDEEHQATPAEWARVAARVKNAPAIAGIAELLEG